ncbi:MAG: heavy metal-associated domain-containing protein [Patescibacteria group bacterium]
MITTKITIQGFHCPSCAKLTKMKLEEISGVSEARVAETGAVEILADRAIAKQEVEQALAGTGYTVQS